MKRQGKKLTPVGTVILPFAYFILVSVHSGAFTQVSAPSPAVVLSRALEQIRSHQEIQFNGTERNNNPLLNITVEGHCSGWYRRAGEMHYKCRDQFNSSESELYAAGDRVIWREPHTDRWQAGKPPINSLAEVLPLSHSFAFALPIPWLEATLAVGKQLTIEDAVLPGEGIAGTLVRFSGDAETSAALLQAFSTALQKAVPPAMLASSTALKTAARASGEPQALTPRAVVQLQFWIAKSSHLVRRLKVEVGMTVPPSNGGNTAAAKPGFNFSDTLTIDYTSYNQNPYPSFPPQMYRLLFPDQRPSHDVESIAASERSAVGRPAKDLFVAAWEQSIQQPQYGFGLDSRTDPLDRTFLADGIFRRDGISEMRVHMVFNEMEARYYVRGKTIAMTIPALGDRCMPFRGDRELEKYPHPTEVFLERFGREARALAAEMKVAPVESLDAKACRVVEYAANTSALSRQSAVLGWDAAAADGSWPDFALTGLEIMRGMEGWQGDGVTEQVRSLHWKIWIGYDDGLIYRMRREVVTRIDLSEQKWDSLGRKYFKNAPDRGRNLTTTLDLRVTDYKVEPDKLPPSVQQFFRYSNR